MFLRLLILWITANFLVLAIWHSIKGSYGMAFFNSAVFITCVWGYIESVINEIKKSQQNPPTNSP